MRSAFTMTELIIAITIIGILTSIAIPRLAATRDDAVLVRAQNTVAALRSAIANERQKRILQGNFSAISANDAINLLQGGLSSDWSVSGNTFTFTAPDGNTCSFTLSNNTLSVDANCNVSALANM